MSESTPSSTINNSQNMHEAILEVRAFVLNQQQEKAKAEAKAKAAAEAKAKAAAAAVVPPAVTPPAPAANPSTPAQ